MEENVKIIPEVQPNIGGGAAGEPGMTVTDTVEQNTTTDETVAHQAAEPTTNGNGLHPVAQAQDESHPAPVAELNAPETEPELEPAVAAEPARPMSLMEQLLNDPSSALKTLHYGEVIEGTVMHKDRDEILVDIGAKSEGVVPNKELQTLTGDELKDIKVGDQILVFVVQPENQEGHAVLSIDKAKMEKSWRRL